MRAYFINAHLIYKVPKKTSENTIRFSFDEEKQAKLDEVAKIYTNYDYHAALDVEF